MSRQFKSFYRLTAPCNYHSVYVLGDSHARRIGERQCQNFVHVDGLGGATSSHYKYLLSQVNWSVNTSISNVFVILGSNDLMKNHTNYVSCFREIVSMLKCLFPISKIYIFPVFVTKFITKSHAYKFNRYISDYILNDDESIFNVDISPISFINNLLVDGVHFTPLVYEELMNIIVSISDS